MLPKTNYVMKNATVWEKGGRKNACRLCGQYIQKEETYYLIVVPMEHRKQHRNFIVHSEEWEKFVSQEDSSLAIIEKLLKTKQPTTKNATQVDEVTVEAVRNVLRNKGYRIKKETKYRIYFKASQNMAQFYFDKRFKTIEFEGRTNGLFDGLFLKEFKSRLNEAINKELGHDAPPGFRVQDAVNKAVETVNQLMK